MKIHYIFIILTGLLFTQCTSETKTPEAENQAPTEETVVQEEPTSQPTTQTLPHQIAKHYGLGNFEDIEKISYTFNVKMGENKVARSWVWEPKTNQVTLTESENKITYNHKNLSSDEDKAADQKFINDKYWLLFPFQIAWDAGYEFDVQKDQPSPIAKTPLTKLSIGYNGKDGYTPGDTYDLYFDENQDIKEWAYTRSGTDKPSLMTTWGEVKTFKGVKIATSHSNADGSFKLWFDGITVE